jgi:hypothetical protein
VKQLCTRRPTRRVRAIAQIVAAALTLAGLAGCSAAPGASSPVATWPVATWPVPPELLPPGTSGALSAEFGPATWALDPAFASPRPDATELHILVWEMACSSGSPATGRMSAPVIAYSATTVTITIGVRPYGGLQACPGPPGTPAIVQLAAPLRTRTLLDGGRVPAAPPSPTF